MAAVAVEERADVVVVAGGRNDGGRDISSAAHTLFTSLRAGLPEARIIAVEPMWDASAYPTFLREYSQIIEREVTTTRGEYLTIGNPLEKRPDLVQADMVHPTVEGQRALAEAVNRAIDRP